jgi:phospholipase/lecithinase/hemolysin
MQSVHSLTDQIQKDFLPHYPASRFPPRQTLYSVWIGINDVLGTAANDSAVNQIFGRALPSALDALVTRGGAKFIMLMDVPPLEAAPDVVKTQPEWRAKVTAAVKRWNERLRAESRALERRHPGVSVRDMSSYEVFSRIAKNPSSYKQTAGLKRVQGFCNKYQG